MSARHVVSDEVPCPECRQPAKRTRGARSFRGRIHLGESVTCAHCGLQLEGDDFGFTQDSRDAFCAVEGKWTARVRNWGPRKVEALSVLRKFRQWTLFELRRVLDEGWPIAEGALVEVESAVEVLSEVGVEIEIQRVPNKGANEYTE